MPEKTTAEKISDALDKQLGIPEGSVMETLVENMNATLDEAAPEEDGEQ